MGCEVEILDTRRQGSLNSHIPFFYSLSHTILPVSTYYLLYFLASKGGNHQLSKGSCLTVQWLREQTTDLCGEVGAWPPFYPISGTHLTAPVKPHVLFFWCFAHKTNVSLPNWIKRCLLERAWRGDTSQRVWVVFTGTIVSAFGSSSSVIGCYYHFLHD